MGTRRLPLRVLPRLGGARQPAGGDGGGDKVLERAVLIRNWSRDLVALTDGSPLDDEARARLRDLGVPVSAKPVARLEGRHDGAEGLSRIVFEDGSSIEREGLFYGPPQRQRSILAESLGCEIVAMGPVAKTDRLTGETSVPGVYAAGDTGTPLQSVALAASSGASASAFLNHTLCSEDAEAEVASAGNGASPAGQPTVRSGARRFEETRHRSLACEHLAPGARTS